MTVMEKMIAKEKLKYLIKTERHEELVEDLVEAYQDMWLGDYLSWATALLMKMLHTNPHEAKNTHNRVKCFRLRGDEYLSTRVPHDERALDEFLIVRTLPGGGLPTVPYDFNEKCGLWISLDEHELVNARHYRDMDAALAYRVITTILIRIRDNSPLLRAVNTFKASAYYAGLQLYRNGGSLQNQINTTLSLRTIEHMMKDVLTQTRMLYDIDYGA